MTKIVQILKEQQMINKINFGIEKIRKMTKREIVKQKY